MSEKEANEKRLLLIRTVLDLSDEVLDDDNFTFWGNPYGTITTSSHNGGSHPPEPPPPPPPPGQ